MNFYQFYQKLNENTVSQELKKFKQNKKFKEKNLVQKIIEEIKYVLFLNTELNLNENSKNIIANWVLFNYFKDKELGSSYLDWLDNVRGKNDIRSSEASLDNLYGGIRKYVVYLGLRQYYDYLAASVDDNGDLNRPLLSKFNNPNFKVNDLRILSDQYHEDLRKNKIRIPGAIGETILEFQDGYKWVDLKKGYCELEGKSMGHCGNAGRKTGDTILSLRDRRNIPHLTFVLNNGVLGERKGVGNSKPVEKYHKYIIELLKLPMVKELGKGNYLPENDFKLSDVKEDKIKDLLKEKPNFKKQYYKELLILEKDVPEEVLLDLIKDDWYVSGVELSGTALVAWYGKNINVLKDIFDRYSILDGPKSKAPIPEILKIFEGLAGNKNVPEEILEKIYKIISKYKIYKPISGRSHIQIGDMAYDSSLIYNIISNSKTSVEILKDLYDKGFSKCFSNQNFPMNIIEDNVNNLLNNSEITSESYTILLYILQNKKISAGILDKIVDIYLSNPPFDAFSISGSLIGHPNISSDSLKKLCINGKDNAVVVRVVSELVKRKEKIPEEALQKLK